jgi:hypothetical protein
MAHEDVADSLTDNVLNIAHTDGPDQAFIRGLLIISCLQLGLAEIEDAKKRMAGLK